MLSTNAKVRTGLDRLAEECFAHLRGLRVGAICNPSSVDRRMIHLADHLQGAEGVELAALFGPEHGIRGDAQDMIGVAPEVDRRTGVVVHSLYGPDVASLSPTAEQLSGLDLLIFDLQDVGSRYYTFAATMLYAMRAAAAQGLRFLVLDRPNPIGGELVEGPTVRPGYESFVSAHPLPIRHGMTVGELALLFRAELGLDLDLEVIPCAGWSRSMLWSETGLPWILPSPNMPSPKTAAVYPGGCLIEGTNLSEGRGTTRPFELWGAPWLDPEALRDTCADMPGVILRPCAFRPVFHKHTGRSCLGVQPHVLDPMAFRPVRLYARLLEEARRQAPEHFAWRTEPYEFVSEPIAIDLLFGSAREREAIEAGTPIQNLFDDWADDERDFLARRAPFLLYS
ncbi:MAG: DUF1343 domain-containing protein [Isosphaeraceae bacterium]|nr:DUF1343 domain-containing protein [Isosphaeraceae bacterium]